ncbi:MAG: hypothetical protein KA735_04875 [Burkholderiaceae bacterium]|nr:hypothetical protein [Burkholderiaceae bacterium]
MKQFGRRWRLEIGSKTDGIEIEGLRVAFEITKSIDAKPNLGKIDVWNLNRDNMNRILSGELNLVKLWVGYDTLRVIYAGDIVKKRVKRDDLDFITLLDCGDGHVDYQNSLMTVTLAAGSTERDALEAAAKTMKNTRPGAIDLPNARALPRARVLTGNARNVLGRVAANNNADWSVQDGELVMIPADKVLPGEAVFLSQETGMIGSPEATDNGLELACLCNPELRVGGLVRVESILEYFNGDYKIVHLQHAGDGIGGDWLSKITVIGGKFQKIEKPKGKNK